MCRALHVRGTALLAVLLALGLTAALVVGGSYVTRRLASASALDQRGAELEPWVEEAVARAVVAWDSVARRAQPLGTAADAGASLEGRIQVTVHITRVSVRGYWVVAEASDVAKPLLRRRLGLLVLAAPNGPAPAPERAWAELP